MELLFHFDVKSGLDHNVLNHWFVRLFLWLFDVLIN